MKAIKSKNMAVCAVAAVMLAASVVCGLTQSPQSVSANSAATWWTGTTIQGVYPLYDCPLEVESENLTFNITSFNADSDTYVTAEYNFYNPTSEDITARLVFPFGTIPDYYYDSGFSTDKFGATVNGSDAGAELRFTFHEHYGDDFEFETDGALLYDYKKEDDYFTEDTVLTAVTFTVPEFTNTSMSPYTYISYTQDDNIRVICNNTWYYNDDTATGEITLRHSGTDEFTIYFAGGVPQDLYAYSVPWRANTNGYGNYLDEDSSTTATFTAEETITFAEYIQSFNPFTGKYAESDWYNLSLDYLNDFYAYGLYTYFSESDIEDIEEWLIYWYDYYIEVPAGGYTVNTVTAPLYPDLFTNYDPTLYEYTYYLSPAATWADFGTLAVTINTPYYLVKSSLDFTQSGTAQEGFVYTATTDGLPQGELTFRLCEDLNPTTSSQRINEASKKALIWALIADAVCVAVAVLVFLLVRHHKKKKTK
ncbi:MAG: hypothetical protein LUF82_03150 [Clostridia bacterium]|nr:hypothetical protein [Clostridia bacterium]